MVNRPILSVGGLGGAIRRNTMGVIAGEPDLFATVGELVTVVPNIYHPHFAGVADRDDRFGLESFEVIRVRPAIKAFDDTQLADTALMHQG